MDTSSYTTSCELSLYGTVWHSKEMCGFATAQAVQGPKLKGFTQGRRELCFRVGESFGKFPPAAYLFGVWLVVSQHLCEQKVLLSVGFA